MTKKKRRTGKTSRFSGKRKHSLYQNRSISKGGGDGKGRSAATVRRLKMYEGRGVGKGRSAATLRRLKMYSSRPKRDSKGKVLKHEFQSKGLPSTHIEPDPRWFGNTRVVSQKQLESFREKLQVGGLSSNYDVILKERKLPILSLLRKEKRSPQGVGYEETGTDGDRQERRAS